MPKNKIRISCGPFKSKELLGVEGDKRETVGCMCNSKCEHWEACWKELGLKPSLNEFRKRKATIKEIELGIASQDKQRFNYVWELIKRRRHL
jgi:hypothetical protein